RRGLVAVLRIPSPMKQVFESAACPFSPLAGRRCRQADEGHLIPQLPRRRCAPAPPSPASAKTNGRAKRE
ncbi:hypothetical protein EBB04_07330, partial [Sinorhizobium meliloti]